MQHPPWLLLNKMKVFDGFLFLQKLVMMLHRWYSVHDVFRHFQELEKVSVSFHKGFTMRNMLIILLLTILFLDAFYVFFADNVRNVRHLLRIDVLVINGLELLDRKHWQEFFSLHVEDQDVEDRGPPVKDFRVLLDQVSSARHPWSNMVLSRDLVVQVADPFL